MPHTDARTRVPCCIFLSPIFEPFLKPALQVSPKVGLGQHLKGCSGHSLSPGRPHRKWRAATRPQRTLGLYSDSLGGELVRKQLLPQPPSPPAQLHTGWATSLPGSLFSPGEGAAAQTSKGTSGSQRLHGAQPGSGHHRFQHRLTPDRGAQGSTDSCTRSNESTPQPAQVLWYDYL